MDPPPGTYRSPSMAMGPPKFEGNDQAQDFLRPLASDTGGFSIFNTNDLDKALDTLNQQISSYYILGFQSNNPKRDGSFRELEVKTKIKDVTLRCRKGYVDKRPLDTLASSRQERSLIDALASQAIADQLPLSVRALYFYDSPRLARVLVFAKIRREKVELKNKRGQSAGDLNVMGVAYAENGNIAARFSESVHRAADKEQGRNSNNGLVYKSYFKLRPGKYRLKIAVADEANNLGSVEQLLEIPVVPENNLAGSSLVIVDDASPLPALIENLRTQLLNENDPFVHAGLQVSPSIENKLSTKSLPAVLFKIYNFSENPEGWKAVAIARLLKDGKEVLSLPQIPLEQSPSQFGATGAAFGLNLPFRGVVPAKYTLVIEIAEAATSRRTTVQTDLEFTAGF